MLLNRNRGLTNLHGALVLLILAAFYWLYAETIITWFSHSIRLTREANPVPYFLSVVVGLVLGWGQLTAVGPRLARLAGGEAAGLATRQMVIVAVVTFGLMFATQDRSISRLFLGSYLVLAWLGLIVLHLMLPSWLARRFFGRGQPIPTLFIGRGDGRTEADEWLRQRTHLGLQMAGYVTLESDAAAETVAEAMAGRNIGQVVLMELPAQNARARAVVEACQARGCRLLLHHDIEERLGHPVASIAEEGHHYFTLHDEPLEEPLNRAVKRLFDLAVSLPLVVLVLPPLCTLVWLMQRFQSPGPLFHIRPRSGEKRAPFPMVKFRTMHLAPASESDERRQAARDDQRIYPFGHFLRRHSLDEFPQFWNVLVGEMSIVGPRPVMPLLDEEFERQARSYRTRHLIRPGITGLAQSRGFRGEIVTPEQLHERVRLDLYYLGHWSLWLDVQIAARTLLQIFLPPPSAY
ncbi:MAG TPA: exopolysaccharide biosynthesis polyprenyl glycosylphosphotransferase [Candidatus Didemnitutus sp.]